MGGRRVTGTLLSAGAVTSRRSEPATAGDPAVLLVTRRPTQEAPCLKPARAPEERSCLQQEGPGVALGQQPRPGQEEEERKEPGAAPPCPLHPLLRVTPPVPLPPVMSPSTRPPLPEAPSLVCCVTATADPQGQGQRLRDSGGGCPGTRERQTEPCANTVPAWLAIESRGHRDLTGTGPHAAGGKGATD